MKRLASITVGVLLASASAQAHHSFAIFDHANSYRLHGRVASFQWTNPHGYIDLEVDAVAVGPAGLKRFTLELTSINMLRRNGWRSSDVHAGDIVSVVTAPLLDGEPAGLLLEINLPDGRTLYPPVPQIDTFNRDPEP